MLIRGRLRCHGGLVAAVGVTLGHDYDKKSSMNAAAKDILRKVGSWPEKDQEELAEIAREIEARRTGVYALSDDEREAIADARRGAFASDEAAAASWKRHGVR
jgi:phage tail tube protein FII